MMLSVPIMCTFVSILMPPFLPGLPPVVQHRYAYNTTMSNSGGALMRRTLYSQRWQKDRHREVGVPITITTATVESAQRI
jgi:hypothetical protein